MSRDRRLTLLVCGVVMPIMACLCLVLLGPAISYDQFESSRFWVIGWSSDSRQLVFMATQGGGSDFWWYAYVVNADGKNLHKLVNKPVQNSPVHTSGAWLPHENAVLLPLRNGGGDPELYVIDVTDGNRRLLTHNDLYEFNFVWSPDGSQLVFWGTDYSPTRSDGLYVLARDGSDPQLLQTFNQQLVGSDFAWSPDGVYVAFRYGDQVYAAQPSRGEVYPLSPTGQTVEQFAWSEDSARLFYQVESKVYAVEADGGEAHPTTEFTFESPPPGLVSPDGRYKAKEGCEDQPPEYTATLDIFTCQHYELHILNATDNTLHARLTRDDLRSGVTLDGVNPFYALLVLVMFASPLLALPYLYRRGWWLARLIFWGIVIGELLLLAGVILQWAGVW